MNQVDIKIEDLSPVKKKLSLGVPWDEVKNELDSAYQKVGKKAKIKGFRPGKVPRKILETYFKDQAEEEAVTNIVNKYYWQTLEEKGISAVSRPEIHQEGLKENTDFSFTASFEIEPEFEPKGYVGIELEKEEIKVSDDDIEKRIDEIRQMFATMQEISDGRAVRQNDFVMIDFAGSMNGESYKELKADDYMLEIGSQRFVPGFEEQMVGMKKGETKEIKVTFPDDYHENKFAGKEVVFNVTLKNINEKKLPENDESFIKNFDKYNTVEDFRNDIIKSLEEKAVRTADINLQNRITEKLVKENDIEAPSALVERQIYYMMADTQRRMMSAGIDENSAMEFSLKMHDKFKNDAEQIVKSFLIIKKIAQKESWAAEDKEVEKYVQDLAEQSGRDYDSLKKMYESEEKMESLKMELIQKKVFDFIEKNANIKVVEKTGVNSEEK